MASSTALSANFADVKTAVDAATSHGDVVTIPPSPPVDWGTNQLVIHNMIVLQGQGMGQTDITSHYSVGNRGAIQFDITASPATRTSPGAGWGLRGMTFTHKANKGNALRIQGVGTAGSDSQAQAVLPIRGTSGFFRVSDLYLTTGLITKDANNVVILDEQDTILLETLDVFGVFDLCIFDSKGTTWCHPHNERWAGSGHGHGSFSDPVDWSSEYFVYFEDCYVPKGALDGYHGARVAARHCTIATNFLNHGTETGSARGTRAMISSNNYYSDTVNTGPLSELRSGTMLEHDSIFGPKMTFTRLWQNHRHVIIKDYGSVDGRNPTYHRVLAGSAATNGAAVDQNRPLADPLSLPSSSNEPTNNNVSADAYTGIASGASVLSGKYILLNVAGSPWSALNDGEWSTLDNPNGLPQDFTQNKGYSYQVVNTTAGKEHMSAGQVYSNTANQLKIAVIAGSGDPTISFANGDSFAIRRVEAGLDQPGHGRSDVIPGIDTIVPNTNANMSVGGNRAVGWPNQKLDPCYTWNCKRTDGTVLKSKTNQGQLKENRDFFNSVKPLPNYSPLLGGLINKDDSPGYQDNPNQGADAKRIGAYGITGHTSDLLWSSPMTGTVKGLIYPHPLRSAATAVISSQAQVTFTQGTGGTFQVLTSNFSGSVTFSKSGSFPATGSTFSAGGLLTVGAGSAAGTYAFTITATDGSSTDTQDFTLTITASPTKVIALTGSLAFGDVDVNTTSQKNLTITNSGNTTLTVTSITLPSGFTSDWSSGGTIAPGATHVVVVTFSPVSAISYSGTVTVASDKTSGTNTTSASGTGTTRIIGLSGSLSFGNITTGQTATRQLTVSNTGNRTLSISSVAYPQGFSGDLATATILAGATKIINVTFSPTLVQAYSGTIDITSNATSGTHSISTTGTGTAAATKIIQLTGSLDFGTVQTGTTPTKVLTITNSGNADLVVSGITYPTGFTGSYAGTIAAGASHDVTVTFSPVSAISYTGDVTVASDATGGNDTTTASGTGEVSATRIVSLSGDLAFGNTVVGSSPTRQFVITNTGNSPLAISSITLPTGFTGSYAGTIAPGANASVTITFSPSAVQSYSGNVTVVSDATSGTDTIAASGAGVTAATRVIVVAGDLTFGSVQKNHNIQRVMTISNTGTSVLTVTDITLPTGFTANWSSGTIGPGAIQSVTVTFRPTAAQSYGGTITVVSNKTSGVNTIGCSGTGTNKKQVPLFIIIG